MKTVDSRCWYCVLRVRRESEHCSKGHNCLVATVNSAKCLPYHHLEPRVQVAERCWPVWKSRPGPIKLSVQDLYERVTKFRFVPAMPASTFYLFVSLFVLDFIIPLFYFAYFFFVGAALLSRFISPLWVLSLANDSFLHRLCFRMSLPLSGRSIAYFVAKHFSTRCYFC